MRDCFQTKAKVNGATVEILQQKRRQSQAKKTGAGGRERHLRASISERTEAPKQLGLPRKKTGVHKKKQEQVIFECSCLCVKLKR